MADIDLAGRVAVVTGAGGGLGRSHALALAARGAVVVVNDVSGGAANAVVEEIEGAGGTALAAEASVADPDEAQSIVDVATAGHGRVDIVVNNAGILRDRSFPKMSSEDLREVLDVHLAGTFNVTHAAWPHMKEQASGRVINTTSPAGLFGNFGQANYSAAKAGIIGLTQTLAIEGARAGILANVVAPLAATRMTETILPQEVLDQLDPELVSPLVVYLASDACTRTGGVYPAGAGFISRAAVVQGPGVTFDGVPTPEGIAGAWHDIEKLELREFPGGAGEQSEWIVGQGSAARA